MTTTTETPYRSVWMCLNDLPFTQGFVDADGIRTRYIQAGPADAPAVIFLHGTGASWGTVSAVATNQADLRGIDAISRATGTACAISATAIGRWK